MYIIYDKTSDWELDYVKNDILARYRDSSAVYVISTQEIAAIKDISPTHPAINNSILIFTSNHISYPDILATVKRLQPLVIIHLSDEWGNLPQYFNLSAYTSLYLRQYSHCSYAKFDKNAYQIPLGYMRGMISDKSSLDIDYGLTPHMRKYTWSFVGNMKNDRKKILSQFMHEFPNNCVTSGKSSVEMYDIYRDSIFVLSVRGNNSLDCFRIYEAIIAGAIPVIIGPEDEIKYTFKYNGESPPCITAVNEVDAAYECKKLLYEPQKLIDIQQQLIAWWKRQITTIRDIIDDKTGYNSKIKE
jgi:hypothetical protein